MNKQKQPFVILSLSSDRRFCKETKKISFMKNSDSFICFIFIYNHTDINFACTLADHLNVDTFVGKNGISFVAKIRSHSAMIEYFTSGSSISVPRRMPIV